MPRTKHRKASKETGWGKVGGFGASKVKRERGRPARPLPPRIDGTPEAMAQAMFRLPADYEWQYEREGEQSIGVWNVGGRWATPKHCTTMTAVKNATPPRQLTV